ncbi:MAG: outer membrane lipoprotein-sorting protein [Verrucomicrobiales bacterium]|jgi:outer membrane lipoprotein-sorting protein
MSATLFRLALSLLVFQSAAIANDSVVVTKWLAGQAKIKSLKADFTQDSTQSAKGSPITTDGKFAYSAPGSFRWQMGEPAVTLAVQKAKGDLVVANLRRKEATIYPFAVLKDEEAAIGFNFIEAGFPKTAAEFDKNFTVTGEELRDGIHYVTVKLNNKRMALGLRKMIFYVADGSFELRGFYLRFRDGSSRHTVFKNVEKDPGVPDAEFMVNLTGYKTKVQKTK